MRRLSRPLFGALRVSHMMNRVSAGVVAVMLAAFALALLRIAPVSATTYADPAAQAAATGQPVELTDQDTETDTVYVNPDGSYTRDVSSEPIRTQTAAGAWTNIDYSLTKEADGTYGPKAAPSEMYIRFGSGGSQPFIVEDIGGVNLTLTWPTALPAPTISGATATYANVYSGIDLSLTASSQGVSEVIVVHSLAAAMNPALKSMTFGVKVTGGTLTTKDGGLALTDVTGRVVAEAPEPMLWDSSGGAPTDSQSNRLDGPLAGDNVAKIALSTANGKLILTPDLSGVTSAAVFPVYIDPTTSYSSGSNWAMVFAQHKTMSFWKWRDGNGQGVGFQAGFGSNTSLKRLFWKFNTPNLDGAKIDSAQFTSYMTWSSCPAKTEVDLYQTSSFGPHTTWGNQPDRGQKLDSVVDSNWSDSGSVAVQTEEFDVHKAMEAVAAANDNHVNFEMAAANEADKCSWKRMESHATLSITYDRPPAAASGLKLDGADCNGANLGASKLEPTLSFHVSDPDSDSVRAYVEYWGTGVGTYEHFQSFPIALSKSSYLSGDIPLPKVNGWLNPKSSDGKGTYSVQVLTYDNDGTRALGWSGRCTFTVDSKGPSHAKLTGPDLTGGWALNATKTLRATAGGTPTDTVGFKSRLDINQPPTSAVVKAVGDDHHLDIAVQPKTYGIHILYVWAYDATGNKSAVWTYQFSVLDPAVWWSYSFDDASGAAVPDDGNVTPKAPMTLSNPALVALRGRWVDSSVVRNDNMLVLGPGIQGRGVSALHLQPAQSFTVAAWLDPAIDEDNPRTMTALTYGDSSTPWVKLGLDKSGRYFLSVYDATSKSYHTVLTADTDDGAPGLREVVGSYSIVTGKLSVAARVRGSGSGWDLAEQGDGDNATTLPSTFAAGHLEVGSGSWASMSAEFWDGRIDQVDVGQGEADLGIRNALYADGDHTYVCGDLDGEDKCA